MFFFTDLVNNVKRSTLVTSLVCVILGLVLLIVPGVALRLVGKLVGALVFAYGLVNVVSYFRSDGIHPVFRFGLVFGVVFALIGAFLFSRAGVVATIVPLAFGIVLLINGVSELQSALDLRRMGDGRWWLTMGTAAVTLLLGLILVFNPFGTASLLVRIIGVCLIYQGVSNLLVAGRVSRQAHSLGEELEHIFDRNRPIETRFSDDDKS